MSRNHRPTQVLLVHQIISFWICSHRMNKKHAFRFQQNLMKDILQPAPMLQHQECHAHSRHVIPCARHESPSSSVNWRGWFHEIATFNPHNNHHLRKLHYHFCIHSDKNNQHWAKHQAFLRSIQEISLSTSGIVVAWFEYLRMAAKNCQLQYLI